MGILDDVVINAKSAAEAVGKKAGQLVDMSKLRINVAELNAEISKRYEALGEYVYETCRETLAEDAEAVGKMAAETASYALKSICYAVTQATRQALNAYPGLEVVFSGGVASNTMLRREVAPLNPVFSPTQYATDNAMGVAVLTKRMAEE